jgi:hypothetical protein
MRFAVKELPANGTAALALVVALLEHMRKDGTLRPKDIKDIAAAAVKLAPQGVGRTDTEARELLMSLM